ncbi:tyrosine-type recombinase/integrase [bacterium]|nr:tyrosine-type recombinase/integrase [bacterium]
MLQTTQLFDHMGRPLNAHPTYLRHADGTGRIYWRGQFRNLPGPYQSPESLAAFHQLCAIVAATGALPITDVAKIFTVAELASRFLDHAKTDYRPGSQEPLYLGYALKPMVDLFGLKGVDEIRPAELRAVRSSMLKSVCRKTANRRATQIVRVFRWGVQEGIVHVDTWKALESVDPIPPGREGTEDYEPIGPVSDEHFRIVMDIVIDRTKDLLRVHRATGARSGELLAMTPAQVDMTGTDWLYSPIDHKTKRRKKDRIIGIPRTVVPILLARMPESKEERWFPLKVNSYYNAVKRACLKAKIPVWHPHQLRHALATEAKKIVGEEAAATLLSVSNEKTAKVYARVTPEGVRAILEQIYGGTER